MGRLNEFAFQISKEIFPSQNMDTPLVHVGFLLLISYLFHLWLSDLRTARMGKSTAGALPGASSCSYTLILVGIAGALFLVAGETVGENMLGISAEQSSITVLFALVTIAAGFGEELVFRGYLLVQSKGRVWLWASVFGFSFMFAILHPYLWIWEDGALKFQLSPKTFFSTGIVFLNSLWFYVLRVSRANQSKSLWPCIAAHASSNAAVFFVKLAQGHVSGIY